MTIYTDEWIENNFDKTNIIIEINNVIKLKNPLGEVGLRIENAKHFLFCNPIFILKKISFSLK